MDELHEEGSSKHSSSAGTDSSVDSVLSSPLDKPEASPYLQESWFQFNTVIRQEKEHETITDAQRSCRKWPPEQATKLHAPKPISLRRKGH
jgi:hypothetical protein